MVGTRPHPRLDAIPQRQPTGRVTGAADLGDPTGQTIIRGIKCDEGRQAWVTQRYLEQYRTLGLPGEPLFIATAFDGDSVSVPGPENYLGLHRPDGTRKPAWQIVHDYAAQVIA